MNLTEFLEMSNDIRQKTNDEDFIKYILNSVHDLVRTEDEQIAFLARLSFHYHKNKAIDELKKQYNKDMDEAIDEFHKMAKIK